MAAPELVTQGDGIRPRKKIGLKFPSSDEVVKSVLTEGVAETKSRPGWCEAAASRQSKTSDHP